MCSVAYTSQGSQIGPWKKANFTFCAILLRKKNADVAYLHVAQSAVGVDERFEKPL